MNSVSKAVLQGDENHWDVVGERELLRTKRNVVITEQSVTLPSGQQVDDYLQIRMPDYTNVLALTTGGQAVCIYQYRHGLREMSLTLPGGYVEAGESALASAQRELREETGYECSHWIELGSFVISANQGIGTAHLFLAKGGRQVAEPDSGDLEDISLKLLNIDQLSIGLASHRFPVLSHTCTIALAARHI